MADKKRKKESCDYNAEVKLLKQKGPGRLYFLWGAESYLTRTFLGQLKTFCLPEGEDSFSYHRFDGPALDAKELSRALDSMPFLSDRSFVELNSVDINKLSSGADELCSVLSEIPDYCTVAFVFDAEYELDRRTKIYKFLKEKGREVYFSAQLQTQLYGWIRRRFAAQGKNIGDEAIERLIYISGDLMGNLIPEIEKVAGFAKGDTITPADVNTVANHISDADTFDMINCISEKEYDQALNIFAELMKDKNNQPIAILASLAYQFRKLYAVKVCVKENVPLRQIMEITGIKFDFMAKNLVASSKRFSEELLSSAIRHCVEAEYRLKSGGTSEDTEVLKEVILRFIAEEEIAKA